MGSSLLGVGFLTLVLAVWWIHFSSFPETRIVDGVEVPVVLDQFNWVPRGVIYKGVGYLAAFAASQMLVAGAFFVWVLNLPMTWARAVFAATMTWVELVIIFGIVPSEWLNYAQTDLKWSAQQDAFTIPSFLVLGNQVGISFAAIKDAISMGYHVVMLTGAAVLAIQVQKMRQGRPATAPRPEPKSPYGRPLVRGSS